MSKLVHFRVVREGKERRRQWAQKFTPRASRPDKSMQNATEMPLESEDNKDMLPEDIVQVLAAREKYVMFFKPSSILDYICVHAHIQNA